MKISSLFAALATALMLVLPAHADTYSYPSKADAWFTLEIPGAWHPKIEDEALEATAPGDVAYVTFWVLKNKEDFKSFDKDLADILKDSVTEPKVTSPLTKRRSTGSPSRPSRGRARIARRRRR